MKQYFSLKLLCASILLVSQLTHLKATAHDDLSAIEVLAQANGKKVHHVHELCKMLKDTIDPDPALVEAAFQEAAACLVEHKEQLAPADLEQLLASLDESFDELSSHEQATKGTKHFTNLVVRQFLSAGTLFVGGNATVGHNLTVNNDAIIEGNLILAGGETINGPVNINTSGTASTNIGNCPGSTTTIAGVTNINSAGTCATTIATGAGSLTLGNAIGNIFFPTNLAVNTPGNYFLAIDASSGELKIDSGSVVPGVILNGGQVGPITIGTTNDTGIAFVTDGANDARLTIDTTGNIVAETGNFTVDAGNIILPAANAGGTQGLLVLGGTNTANNVNLYEIGARNFFLGNGAVNSNVTGSDNIALGSAANVFLSGAVSNTVAIGSASGAQEGAQALATGAIAIGAAEPGVTYGAYADAVGTIAIGVASESYGVNGIAFGTGTVITAADGIAMGDHASAEQLGIAIGSRDSTSTGVAPTVSAINAIAIGSASGTLAGPVASMQGAVAIGGADGTSHLGAHALGSQSVAIAPGAFASGPQTVAIGYATQAQFLNGVAVGPNANANGGFAISVGPNSAAGANSISLGASFPNAQNLLALGTIGTQTSCYIAGVFGVTTSGGTEVFINSSGQLGTISSSIKYKDNVRDLGASSERIYDLRPVAFNYKQHSADQISVGLIAEEVATAMPEMVVHNTDGSIETVKYHDLVPHLLNEAQKHQEELQELRAEVAILKAALSKLL